jgi:hypothetical protein
MPKALERKLKRTAAKRGYGKERTGAYVYGTLYNQTHGGGKKKKKR